MQVIFFSYSKRPNSTARPTPGSGTSCTCQIKEESSFINPILKLSNNALMQGTFNPSAFNYCMISYWQRYYYITDWVYLNGIWECYLSVDVLASFKTQIGLTSAYVTRSHSAYNGDIIDNFYPTTSVQSIVKISISSDIYHTTISGGCYVLGCINNVTTNRFGAVTYYVLNDSQMGSLLNYLFSNNIYNDSNITEMGEGLYKSMFNPFQYIVSCNWFPFPASAVGTTSAEIKVGYWSTGVTGALAQYIVKEIGFKSNTAIPLHPQSTRGNYLNHAPYTTVTAYYPPFGEIPVDTSFMQYGSNNYFYGRMFIDFITGVADCYFSITNGYEGTADPYKFMTMRSAQVGVPIQLSQVMTDYVAVLEAGANSFQSGLTLNFGGIFKNALIGEAASYPKVSSIGANGSLVEIIEPPYLIVQFNQVVNEDIAEHGRPLCAVKTINTLSGYIQCGDNDFAFGGTKAENEQINNYMHEGFFYE